MNQRLNLKMDLPSDRETVLAMFDRVRREFPAMDKFRRLTSELVLESEFVDATQRWIALRKTSIRSGVVNPPTTADAYALHKLALEVAPYFLSISPLDVDYLELNYGFDLLAHGNHDQIVFDALYASSPLGKMLELPGARPMECQPIIGMALSDAADLQAFVEVKTRTPGGAGSPAWRGEPATGPDAQAEPISVFLTLRRCGPVRDVAELVTTLADLSKRGEQLLKSRVVPSMLVPIRDSIASNNA
ncbi:MAG: hypothetical protein AB7K52_02915 [Phycisphaerales bacterium]